MLHVIIKPLPTPLSAPTSYASSSQEFQTRQFADLSFLLQSYEQAFLNYSAVKKDFHVSSAWMHYAGAVVCTHSTHYI